MLERDARDANAKVAFVSAAAAAGHRNPDFADSLSGGPDYWEVTRVGAGDALSLRNKPSPRAAKVAQFQNGTVLRKRGCKISRGQRRRCGIAGFFFVRLGQRPFSARVGGTKISAAGH